MEKNTHTNIPLVRKTLICLERGPDFLTPHEPPENSTSRKNSYSNKNDSKVMKTTNAMAFEPAGPLLGMYILMHVQNDEHTEIFASAPFTKTKG